jgi:phage gp29-like protein
MVNQTRTSSILGPDGNPIQTKVLSQEVATPTEYGVRRVIEDREASGLTPFRLANLLRDAETGNGRAYLTLAMEMEERYHHYSSQVQTRRLAIEGIEATVQSKEGVPSKITDAVLELVEDSSFADAVGDLTDGIAKGYAATEMMWEYQNKLLRPVEYKWRDQRFFVFDRLSLTEMRLATDTDPIEGAELPAHKFIQHMPRSKVGIPIRTGLARPAAWGYVIQSYAVKDWSGFAEIYGVPLRLGRYGTTASDEDKRSLLRAVKMISNDGAAIAPAGMEIEFVKVEGQHGSAVFGELIEYIDRNISKLVLGQTMTSDDGSSMAQAKIHNDVRLDILKADCRQLAQTINRDLIKPFVAFNFGPQEVYPQLEFPVAEPEDTKALADNLAKMVPLGLRVSQRAVLEKFGLPEPQADEELLSAPANKVSEHEPPETKQTKADKANPGKAKLSAIVHGSNCSCDNCQSTAQLSADNEDDEIDHLVDAALDNWEELADPLLTPLRTILDKASNLKEAQAMLSQIEPDSGPLAEKLAELTSIARGLGDISDDLPDGDKD